jgi:hypothetical protein
MSMMCVEWIAPQGDDDDTTVAVFDEFIPEVSFVDL